MSQRFDSVLVANRGEIACRVIRSARALGYRTVAVYSEADANAPHVRAADQAVLLGPAPVKDSYLNPQRILEAAQRANAGAVHPGYGFLSENADFAQACGSAGLVFVGPSPAAIEAMGNKAESKRRMVAAGVPCIPGYQDADQSDKTLLGAAKRIGTPLMVKAAAGGGGRGMRLVTDIKDLPQALASARSEAEGAFGCGELILEKALLQPRHVEVQVFGDSQGNTIHLGERDCSVQRRHQKVVEEAPCPVLTAELRGAMGAAAVNAARSIDYVGAGTVEFLLDTDGSFYFLEMNTRLQVEHPVTELVTGLDLVALQLAVAQGEALPLTQDDVALRGHAIEVRLYAEDCGNDFLPASGTALLWRPPAGDGVRVDHGLGQGQAVSPFYDPMVAKVIASGSDRETARRRLVRALEDTVLFGFASNRAFLIDVLNHPRFADGSATTAFVAEQFAAGHAPPAPSMEQALAAACLHFMQARDGSASGAGGSIAGEFVGECAGGVAGGQGFNGTAPPPTLRGWSSGLPLASPFRYALDGGDGNDGDTGNLGAGVGEIRNGRGEDGAGSGRNGGAGDGADNGSGNAGAGGGANGDANSQTLDLLVSQLGPNRYRVAAPDGEHEVAWLGGCGFEGAGSRGAGNANCCGTGNGVQCCVGNSAGGGNRVDNNGCCKSGTGVVVGRGCARVAIDNMQHNLAWCFPARGQVTLQLGGRQAQFSNLLAFTAADLAAAGSGTVVAPMHGNLLQIMVAVGDRVAVGDGLAVMEAMKMEHRLTAEVAGEVIAVHANAGDQVAAGAVLLEIEAQS